MKFIVLLLALMSLSVNSAPDERSDIQNNIALHHALQSVKQDVEQLKLSRNNIIISPQKNSGLDANILRLELSVSNLEKKIDGKSSNHELSIIKENLFSRIDSSDESIANWGVLFGLLGTGWGLLVTLMSAYIGFLNTKKADDVVSQYSDKVENWIKNTAPEILKDGSSQYIAEIKDMRDEAERVLLSYAQHRNQIIDTIELTLDDEFSEPISERVNSVLEFYKTREFAEAVLKAKFILEGTVNNRDRIELLQVISNSYNAIDRPDLADEYNIELLRVINATSMNISAYSRANILLKIAMNKYSLRRKSDTKDILGHLNDIISEFLGSKNIKLMRIVAKARMLKSIINENSGYFASSEEQYKEIIGSYKGISDRELEAIVKDCESNLVDIQKKGS